MVLRRLGRFVAAGVITALTIFSTEVYSDGTENLGPASIDLAAGSGISIGGVGLFTDNGDGTFTNMDGDMDVSVPPGATVEQVILYWIGETGPTHDANPVGDDSASVNGNPVTGTLIGGATRFFGLGDGTGGIWYETYRADITDLGLVSAGDNTLTITDLDFTYRNTGAGVIVIFDDGTGALIEILDGLDLAYHKLSGDLETVVPQTLTFDSALVDRVAQVPFFVGSVGTDRPNVTEITTGGVTTPYFDLFTSAGGPEWDSVLVPITIPAGADSVTIDILSADGGDTGLNPASFAWAVSGIVIEDPEEEECGECDGKVTQLTLSYLGDVAANVTVVQKKDGQVVFDGSVNPGEAFTFTGQDDKGTLSTEIEIFINGSSNTKIHTSCSVPIGPGLISGLFEVLEGYSRNGGLLCEPVLEDPGSDCECDGKVTQLSFEYSGAAAQVTITQKDGEVVFDAFLNPGDHFTIDGVDKNGTLSTEIDIAVAGTCHANIHTSCSKPIGPGLQAGDFLVLSGISRNGGELCEQVAADAQVTTCSADKPNEPKAQKAKKKKGKKKHKGPKGH